MNSSRHDRLIAAGWIYDSDSDRYRAPGDADDGTATLYNQAAAWQRLLSGQIDSASTPDDRPPRRMPPDPRIKEPE